MPLFLSGFQSNLAIICHPFTVAQHRCPWVPSGGSAPPSTWEPTTLATYCWGKDRKSNSSNVTPSPTLLRQDRTTLQQRPSYQSRVASHRVLLTKRLLVCAPFTRPWPKYSGYFHQLLSPCIDICIKKRFLFGFRAFWSFHKNPKFKRAISIVLMSKC